MKKRVFNAADVFIILVLIACVVGIAVRAFRLTDVKTDKFYNYRVSFTARIDDKQLEKINPGIVFSDGKNTEFTLLEGYWISNEQSPAALNGELLVYGRLTENGFETSGGYYYKNDKTALKGDGFDFDVTLTDFTKQ